MKLVLPLLAALASPIQGPVPRAEAADAANAADAAVEAARAHRGAHGGAILREFCGLLEIPNVAWDAANARRNAERIVELYAARGAELRLDAIESVPPLVLGRLEVPGAERTLGIYVHYDGQPVDEKAWTFGPWTPTLTTAALQAGGTARALPEPDEPWEGEWRLYARSAGDDKAPLVALLAALDALRAAEIPLTSNLVFLFEGQEEIGSLQLERYMLRNREALAADAWLVCDGPVHQSRRPQLVFGVRGITSLEITVYGPLQGLHSGHYGNWAPNPAMMLAQLLASMKDGDGNVLIEGFHDGVTPLSEADRAALRTVPDVDAALRREFGLGWTEGGGAPLAERLLLPSLNVRGLRSAEVGPRARNVIPPTATAAIDIRLVAGLDPGTMGERVERHVAARGYTVVRAEPDLETRLAHARVARITRTRGYPAVRTPMDGAIARDLAAAAERAAGEPVILMPALGGSLPLYLFERVLGTPLVIVPIANHDDAQHAPDENLRLANLGYGIDLFAAILTMP